MKHYLLLISIFLFLTSCKDWPKTANQAIDKASGNELLTDQSHQGKVSIDTLEKYKKLGQKYASRTKAALGKKLVQAITDKGPDGAVEFCNINAMPLTDSLSLSQGAKIRRVTDKPRNPLNKANGTELSYIAEFKEILTLANPVEPILDTTDGQIDFYYPITTNAMCLQCHGVPEEQITTSTLTVLDKLYPNDMACNYQENEVRGIWAIRFNRN